MPADRDQLRKLFMSFGKKVEDHKIADLVRRAERGERFTLAGDEYTSNGNKRYMGIELHTFDKRRFSMGLVRINGACPGVKAKELITKRVEHYGLNVKVNIVAFVSDGAPVMKAGCFFVHFASLQK